MVDSVRDHLDAVSIRVHHTHQLILGGKAGHEQGVGMSAREPCPRSEESRLDSQMQVRIAEEGCVVKCHYLFGSTSPAVGQGHGVVR